MSETVFISYAHIDGKPFAQKLSNSLAHRQCQVFFDEHSLPPGSNFIRVMQDSILESKYFLAVLTPGHRRSDWCNDEWELAKRNGKHIIPVLAEECDLRGFIGSIQAIDFRNTLRDESKFASRFDQLMNVIERPQNWRETTVKQLGTHRSIHTIQCIKKDALLTDALTRMNDDDFRFRHFLVTHDGKVGGKLEGIIGYRNILKKEKDPTLSFHDLHVRHAMRPFVASKFPKPTFVHLHETDSLQTALGEFTLRLNKEVGIELNYFYMSAIPIVDNDNRATGIITFKDVMGAMVRGEIPIPNTTVGAIMRKRVRVTPPTETPMNTKHETQQQEQWDVVATPPTKTPMNAKYEMLQLGQRDVVVVDNEQDRTFLGMVSDNERIVHSHLDIPVEDIMIPHHDFEAAEFCLTSETTVAEMLSKYILTDYSKTFYDLPVISYRPNGRPHFEGLVGYRDVFLELAKSNSVVYYQDVAP